MSQTICVYAGPQCPQNWIVNVIERHLSLGKFVNYYNSKESVDIETCLDPKLTSSLRKIHFENDAETVGAFKEQKFPKVAVGVTKMESLDLGSPSVLVDVPTFLVLESADVASLSVLVAQKLNKDCKNRSKRFFPSLNVVILECFEKEFVKLLRHYGTGQNINFVGLDCFANFDKEISKLEKESAVIVQHCNTKTQTFLKDHSKVPIINVHPVRTIQEGINYVSKFPYKSSLYLWTDSVSILFSSWKKLDFANVYANSVMPVNKKLVYLNGANISGSFMNSALVVTPGISSEKPIHSKEATKIYEITLKNKSLTFKDSHEQILKNFPSWKFRGPGNILCWAETDPTCETITECKPKQKLSVGAYISDFSDILPTFLYVLSVCGWAKLVVIAPEEFRFGEHMNFQVSEVQISAAILKADVVFTPDGSLKEVYQIVDDEKLFEGCCVRSYGVLAGPELAKHIVVESSLLKQIQIPFNFITT